jgi:hypothetical protein
MELHCFLYFAAIPSLQPLENKEFASKIWVGGTPRRKLRPSTMEL